VVPTGQAADGIYFLAVLCYSYWTSDRILQLLAHAAHQIGGA
jgi:hypothetical protein